MKKMASLTVALAAIGALSLAFANDAEATLLVRLTQGADDATVIDGDADGIVTFAGSVGVFTANFTVGRSKPNVGSATEPALRLLTFNSSSTTGGTLTIEVTDTGFGPVSALAFFNNRINSADLDTGTVTYQAFIDNSDAVFGQGQEIINLGPASGVFDLGGIGSVSPTTPFSVTMLVTLVHNGAGNSQFDASLNSATPIPEPASLGLFGLGLLGLGFLARRRVARPLGG